MKSEDAEVAFQTAKTLIEAMHGFYHAYIEPDEGFSQEAHDYLASLQAHLRDDLGVEPFENTFLMAILGIMAHASDVGVEPCQLLEQQWKHIVASQN